MNQYLGGSTIFMKAKRSLTNSFDHLLKRKGSRDDFGPILKEMSLPMNAALCKARFYIFFYIIKNFMTDRKLPLSLHKYQFKTRQFS